MSGSQKYHADHTAISHSMLEVFRGSRPRYHGLFVGHSLEPAQPSRAMEIGSCLHALALENRAAYAVAPECDRRTKAGKLAWDAFQATCDGKMIVSGVEEKRLVDMAEALQENPMGRMLLETRGVIETPIYWDDLETGLSCKAKPDKLIDSAGIVVDLKTCLDVSPEAFSRAVANYGYHRQAAWYLEGIRRLHKISAQFLFLCVGKEPPHEVATYELSQDALSQGTQENRELLEELKECHQSGYWGGRWEKEIFILNLPRWAQTRKEPDYVCD